MEAPLLQAVERDTAWVCAGLLFVFSACLGFLYSGFGEMFDTRDHGALWSFDPAVWKDPDWVSSASPESHNTTIRLEMSSDLIAHHLMRGLTRADVRKLLGAPDGGWNRDPEWIYLTDSVFADSGAYAVRVSFDSNGLLTEASLVPWNG